MVQQVEEQKSGVREYIPVVSPTASHVHREQVFVERQGYQSATPPPAITMTTLNRNEQYLQQSNGFGSAVPGHDLTDHSISKSERTERILYQNEAAPGPTLLPDSTRTTIKQFEERYSNGRPPRPTYYPETTQHSSSTHIYKYDEQQSLLPKPFPTSERPSSPRQQPPRRIEDLMASFSDSEVSRRLRSRGIILNS